MSRQILPLLIAALALACTCGSLPELAAPTPPASGSLPEQPVPTAAPRSDREPAATPPAPVEVGRAADHYPAMRPGFEGDVDAFADSTRYAVSLSLQPDPLVVTGTETVRFVNRTPDALTGLVFRLYPNALVGGGRLTVAAARVDGQPVEPALSVSDTALTLPLIAPLPPGEAAEAALDFSLTLPADSQIGYGRLANTGGVIILSSFLPLLSVYEADGWWLEWPDETGDPVYSAAALFDVTLTAPAGWQAAATGTAVSTRQDSDRVSARFVTGPVRDFSLALGRELEVDESARNGVTVRVWSLPGSSGADQAALNQAAAAVEVFDAQFGRYPFSELDVFEAPVVAAGIEYPGLIYIAEDVWRSGDDRLLEWVVVHEAAHQWWYSLVGNDQVTEPWLDEGLAEFSVEVYFRQVDGRRAGQRVRDTYQDELDGFLDGGGSQEPVGLPAETYDGYEYRVFVYSGGALFYSYLEDDYGPEAVQAFLQTYFDRHRYGIADNAAMRALLVESFGEEAGAFFDEWVYPGG